MLPHFTRCSIGQFHHLSDHVAKFDHLVKMVGKRLSSSQCRKNLFTPLIGGGADRRKLLGRRVSHLTERVRANNGDNVRHCLILY